MAQFAENSGSVSSGISGSVWSGIFTINITDDIAFICISIPKGAIGSINITDDIAFICISIPKGAIGRMVHVFQLL